MRHLPFLKAVRVRFSCYWKGLVVKLVAPRSLVEIITKHPWSSLRDGVALSAVMTIAVLIARRYDIFVFFQELADPQREISSAEAVLLSVMAVGCIWWFVVRRLNEERCDVSYQTRLESEMSELRELALQDPLTQLPNRRALLAALDSATADFGPDCRSCAVFLLDLNGFKRVNDLYGHCVGDHVLQVVAERFRRVTRPSDLLARLGGDEFAVLSYDVDRTGASAVGARFVTALKHGISADGHFHELGAAIGAVVCPEDGVTGEAILRNADRAMYRAKLNEGSALAFFDPAINSSDAVRKASG